MVQAHSEMHEKYNKLLQTLHNLDWKTSIVML